MKRRFLTWIAAAAVLFGGAPAIAALQEVGPPISPHGYPQYYGDANGLRLQLCREGDGLNGMCIFDPVDPADPASVALEVGAESFWWMATAFVNAGVADVQDPQGIDAELTLALEGAFGGAGGVNDGDQVAFGRLRIRVDTPVAGTYTITHPFGTRVFENVPAGIRGINMTEDIGAFDFLDPAGGFGGALLANIGPFLTWPDYANPAVPGNEALQVPVLDGQGQPTGEIIQYIGDPQVPHLVTGSPYVPPGEMLPANYFRIQGPGGIDVRTELFGVMGKVLPDPAPVATPHVFPPPPAQNLFAMGPINRAAPFAEPTTGVLTGELVPGYPIGFPLWYQANAGTMAEPAGGVRLTLCPPSDVDPMCISSPVDPLNPESLALSVGDEAFWWSAESFINENTADVGGLPAGLDGQLTLALEGAFGGAGSANDGDQLAFGRVRVRIDVPAPGTYTVTHPYGVEVFENVTVLDGINFTRDLGVIDPRDPDGSFVGALHSDIGPAFLTWPDFDQEPGLQIGGSQYVGDPAVAHVVTGSTFVPPGELAPANYFRIQGPDGLDVTTFLFNVSGKVFDPAVFPTVIDPSACFYRGGAWYFDQNGNGTWDGTGTGLDFFTGFGAPDMQPVTGDWNGDGSIDLGAYVGGTWYLDANGNGAWDGTGAGGDLIASFGSAAMQPVVGDWNADGRYEIGAYENGTWYLDANGNGTWDGTGLGADRSAVFGTADMQPVSGDWNGDGVFELGAYQDGAWYLDTNGNGQWDGEGPGGDRALLFGTSAMRPVVGDWDGDGRHQAGAWENGTWYLDLDDSGDWNPLLDQTFVFGEAGDIPMSCGGGSGGAPAPGAGFDVAGTGFVTGLLAGLSQGFSAAVAINDQGLAVGLADDGSGLKAVSWSVNDPFPTPATLAPLAGNDYSGAYGVNAAGTVVGESEDGDEVNAVYWPFGSSTPLSLSLNGLPGGSFSTAYGINLSGGIAGEAADDTTGGTLAIYWGSAVADPTVLAHLVPGGSSSAYAINDEGVVVGESLNAAGAMQAVAWPPAAPGAYGAPLPLPEFAAGQISSLALSVDGGGRIVGEAEGDDGSIHGLLWTLNADRTAVATTQDYGPGTSAQGISVNDLVVGMADPGTGADSARLWDGGEPADNRSLAAALSQAFGINAGNQVVGILNGQAFFARTE